MVDMPRRDQQKKCLVCNLPHGLSELMQFHGIDDLLTGLQGILSGKDKSNTN